jgi:hypothetical protein
MEFRDDIIGPAFIDDDGDAALNEKRLGLLMDPFQVCLRASLCLVN